MSMKKFLAILAFLLPVGAMAQHWTAATTQEYPNSTPVYVQVNINGVPTNPNSGLELAAFISDECRAVAGYPEAVPAADAAEYRYILRVAGDLAAGANQQITFRAFYDNVEYEFTTKASFTGETDYTPSSPLVLNLDAVTGVTLTNPIEITQPATAFPYTQDLTPNITLKYETMSGAPYTPLGESEIISPIEYEWNVGNYVDQLTFDGNSLTIGPAEEANYGITFYMYIGNRKTGECKSFERIPTTIAVTIAKIPVESITCSIESTDFFTWENFDAFMRDKVTVLPADASDPSFYLEGGDFLSDGMFVKGGKYVVTIIPNDEAYEGEYPTVNVTVFERPTNIASAQPNGLEVGVGENVFAAIAASTNYSWMNDTEPEEAFAKKDLAYKVGTEGYIDEAGVATTVGQVLVTVTLVNGITPDNSAPVEGKDSYEVPVNIVTRLDIQVQGGETSFVKGIVSKASPAVVYVSNPGNEPFDQNALTIQFVDRYEGFPYAEQTALVPLGTSEETGATMYGFYILPKFVAEEAYYEVLYNGEPQADRNSITITQQQELAEGWNWISVNSLNSVDGNDVASVFTQDDIVEIRSQSALLYNDAKYGYFGDISNLNALNATYKVKTNKATTAQWGSVSAFDAKQMYDEIMPGYNWINNPFEFDIRASRIGDFLGESFAPTEGDRIITLEDGFATYSDGEWVAADGFALKEGKGLIYFDASTESVEARPIMFNRNLAPEIGVPLPGGVKGFKNVEENAAANLFQYDAHAFADNMSMVATIEGLENPEDYTLGVFVNGECRGRGQVVKDGKMFVNAVGKVGEQMTFKLANNFTGEIVDLDETMTHSLIKGSLKAPVAISGTSVTGIVKTKQDVQDDAVYDMSGRRVQKMQKGIYIKNGKKFINK